MALVDTMCVRGGGYWWKMRWGRLAGTHQEGLWTMLRSLPLTHDAEEPGEGSARHMKDGSEELQPRYGGLAGAGKAGGREAGRGDKQSWPGVQGTKRQKQELLRYLTGCRLVGAGWAPRCLRPPPLALPHLTRPSSSWRRWASRFRTSAMASCSSSVRKLRSNSPSASGSGSCAMRR